MGVSGTSYNDAEDNESSEQVVAMDAGLLTGDETALLSAVVVVDETTDVCCDAAARVRDTASCPDGLGAARMVVSSGSDPLARDAVRADEA